MNMKNIWSKRSLSILVAGSILLVSCYKSFDSKTYRPQFTVNGYASSNDIGKGSLVAYWAFDGSTIDSVSQTSGTSVNTSFATGFKGQALQGSANGYVISDLPAALKSLGSFTIDFWINTPQNTNGIVTPICITKDNDFWSSLEMFYENGSTGTSANFKIHYNDGQHEVWFTTAYLNNPWNAWQNIALTYNAATTTFSLYQGGTFVASQAASAVGNAAFSSAATSIVFGTEQFQCNPSIGTAGGTQGWASYLTGQLDEVRIYNTALAASDLQALIILQGKGK